MDHQNFCFLRTFFGEACNDSASGLATKKKQKLFLEAREEQAENERIRLREASWTEGKIQHDLLDVSWCRPQLCRHKRNRRLGLVMAFLGSYF